MAYDKSKIKEIKETIIELLSVGNSLKFILDHDSEMPSRAVVYNWLNEYHKDYDEVFLNNYMRAREESADIDAEMIEEIAEKTLKGTYDPQSARVAIDAFKWTSAKKQPKKYGDRLDLTSGHKPLSKVSEVEVVVKRYNEDRD